MNGRHLLVAASALVLVAASALVGPALACEPGAICGEAGAVERVSARAEHLSSACAYSTEVVLRQVVERGTAWSFVGRLRDAEPLASRVAAPYVVGPDQTRVVANAVLDEVIANRPLPSARLELEGRVLDLHEQRFFVVTSARMVAAR